MTVEQPLSRIPRWLALVLVLVALLLGVLSVKRVVNHNADFNGNHRWWQANLQAPTLPERRAGADSQDPDSYPPITYALYAPLGALPLGVAATVWYVINLGCSIHLWRAARQWLKLQTRVDQVLFTTDLVRYWRMEPVLFLNLAVLAVVPCWIGCLLLGQNTLPIMTLTWAGYQAARRHRDWLAGALLALATTLKVLPFVFVLPFVMRVKLRVVTACAISGLLLVFGLGSLYFGPQTNWEFHQKWLQYAARGSENRPMDPRDPDTLRGSLRYHNQSIESVLARLMADIPIHNGRNAPRVNLCSASAGTWRLAQSATKAVCVLLGVLTLVSCCRRWLHSGLSDSVEGESQSNALQPIQGIAQSTEVADAQTSVEIYSLMCLLQLFISPIVWSHYYLWLFWPLLWLLVSSYRGRRSGYVLFVLWLACLPLLSIPQARAVGTQLWLTLALYLWICWPHLSGILRGARRSPSARFRY